MDTMLKVFGQVRRNIWKRSFFEPVVALLMYLFWIFSVGSVPVFQHIVIAGFTVVIAVSRVLPRFAAALMGLFTLMLLTLEHLSWTQYFAGLMFFCAGLFCTFLYSSAKFRKLFFVISLVLALPFSVLYRFDDAGSVFNTFASEGSIFREPIFSEWLYVFFFLSMFSGLFVQIWWITALIHRQNKYGEHNFSSLKALFVQSKIQQSILKDSDTFSLIQKLPVRGWAFDLGLSVAVILGSLVSLTGAWPPINWLQGGNLFVVFLFFCALSLRRYCVPVAFLLYTIGTVGQIFFINFHLPVNALNFVLFFLIYSAAAYPNRTIRIGSACTVAWMIIGGSFYLYLQIVFGNYLFGRTSLYTVHNNHYQALGFLLLIVLVGWLSGMVFRSMRAGEALSILNQEKEREKVFAFQIAASEQERVRIARDMHDVIAHTLAVIIAQSDGARYSLETNPKTAGETLETIANLSRSALGDVRHLLGELRYSQPAGPQPTIKDIEDLIPTLRASDTNVMYEKTGDFSMIKPAQELALYRIVQESLTNALRHSDTLYPIRVTLTGAHLGQNVPHVKLLVRSRLKYEETPKKESGYGIAGMKERALLAGGTLEIVKTDTHFIVSALFLQQENPI